ncbi:MAG: flagellar protein FlaG [Lachnospiraceae bacterium]
MSIEGIKGTGMGYQGSASTPAIKAAEQPKTEAIVMDRALADMEKKTTDFTIKEKNSSMNNQSVRENQEKKENPVQMSDGFEAMKKAVNEINKHNENSIVQFGIHEATNRMTVKILDKETKKVIKEFPAEKTLDLIAKAWEIAGLLVDERR